MAVRFSGVSSRAEPLPAGGRALAHVHDHVEDRAPGAAHQLGLGRRRDLVMQPADRACLRGSAEIGLHELGDQPVFGEFPCAEGAGEKTPLVAAGLEVDQVGAGKRRLGENHLVTTPELQVCEKTWCPGGVRAR
jgi:hypothetical protein